MIGDLLNITEMTKQIANAAGGGENQTPTTAEDGFTQSEINSTKEKE